MNTDADENRGTVSLAVLATTNPRIRNRMERQSCP
jgi:hypothetical protein